MTGWTKVPGWLGPHLQRVAQDVPDSPPARTLLAVWTAVADRCTGDTGRDAIASHKALARACFMHPSTVRRATAALEAGGLLTATPQWRDDGSQAANAWTVLMTPPKGTDILTHPCSAADTPPSTLSTPPAHPEQGPLLTAEQGGCSAVSTQEQDPFTKTPSTSIDRCASASDHGGAGCELPSGLPAPNADATGGPRPKVTAPGLRSSPGGQVLVAALAQLDPDIRRRLVPDPALARAAGHAHDAGVDVAQVLLAQTWSAADRPAAVAMTALKAAAQHARAADRPPPPTVLRPPWCGHPDCDERTRRRDTPAPTPHDPDRTVQAACPDCHPSNAHTDRRTA